MSIQDISILGVVQGITEFLPVSSSGHLLLASYLMERMPDLTVSVYLHAGTLGSVFCFFRREIMAYIRSFKPGSGKKEGIMKYRREAMYLLLANVPTAIIGLWVKRAHDWTLGSYQVAMAGFVVTTAVLLTCDRLKESKRSLSAANALVVGAAQGIAVLPGISRSGITIFAAMLAGMSRGDAFKFSFLMSVPAVAGATFLEFLDAGAGNEPLTVLVPGVIISFITGIFSLELLRRIVLKSRLSFFGVYTGLIALTGIVYMLFCGAR